jgi:hypothetical protein
MAARILMQCYYTVAITFIGYFILTIFKKK